jgi:hypothetical protein
MRHYLIKISVAVLMCAPFTASGSLAADWNGSYSANGQCFCVGEVSSAVESLIVPTPIGGQTVAQVCQRVGTGPGLKITEGLYSHPVYADSQCGHGPPEAGSTVSDSNCVGSLDGKATESESCQPMGPRWDIKQAFLKQSANEKQKDAAEGSDTKGMVKKQKIVEQGSDTKELVQKQANTSVESKPSASLIDKPVVTSISVKRKDDLKGTTKTLEETVISSASTAGRDLPKREPLASFTGKVITIDGKRYLQAKQDLPANGGQPGSRIILDGSVFLLDDGTIKPTDLYRTQLAEAKKPKRTTSKKSSKALKQRVAGIIPKQPVKSKSNQASTRQVGPLLTPKTVREDRNSIPSAQPVPVESKHTGAITKFDAVERANEKSQIVRPKITQISVAVITEPKPVTDLSEFKKADRLPQAILTVDGSKQLETVTIQLGDDTAKVEQSAVSEISTVAEDFKKTESSKATNQVSLLSALKLPASANKQHDRFSYVEAMPVSFDVGGSGLLVKGSSESHSKFHYVGRIGVTNTYQEAMLGGGYYLTPSAADKLTMVLQAGVEYGSFRLEDDQSADITVNYNDTGLYFGAATRFVLNHRFELGGGFGYSTFFKGDLSMFGGAYWHMTPQLDLVSQFELGDNDLVGLGIRFYY